jgi:hypothetical protein
MEERWVPVLGGLYEISNLGRARSVTRTTKDGRVYRGKVLRLALDSSKYPMFCSSRDGVRKSYRVHPFVAKHFLGRRPRGYIIDHVDGNKRRSSVDNLEYVTHAESQRRASALGLLPTKKNARWHRKWRP